MAVNLCLAANGGILGGDANEAMRDNDFTTAAVYTSSSQSTQQRDSYITFPSSKVSYIMFRCSGTGSASNNPGYCNVYLYYSGGWQLVATYNGSGANSVYDSTTTTMSTGWNNVTGIRMFSYDYTSAAYHSLYQYEIQAWGGKPTSQGIII